MARWKLTERKPSGRFSRWEIRWDIRDWVIFRIATFEQPKDILQCADQPPKFQRRW